MPCPDAREYHFRENTTGDRWPRIFFLTDPEEKQEVMEDTRCEKQLKMGMALFRILSAR